MQATPWRREKGGAQLPYIDGYDQLFLRLLSLPPRWSRVAVEELPKPGNKKGNGARPRGIARGELFIFKCQLALGDLSI